jgi:hypothetical protein
MREANVVHGGMPVLPYVITQSFTGQKKGRHTGEDIAGLRDVKGTDIKRLYITLKYVQVNAAETAKSLLKINF